jgi:hypothetical protein
MMVIGAVRIIKAGKRKTLYPPHPTWIPELLENARTEKDLLQSGSGVNPI